MQTTRLFQIVYILLDKKIISARELATRLNVSTRTIHRDIDTLSLAGIPIFAEKGRGGGIRLLPNFVLNKSLLSAQEQDEILAALQGHALVQDENTTQILHKLSTLFNKPAANWIEVDFSDWSYRNNYFDQLKGAILGQHVIEFDYFNAYGDTSFRRVEPIKLWFKSTSWYLRGFCLTKQGARTYKLSRMQNLVVTAENFCTRTFDVHSTHISDTPSAATPTDNTPTPPIKNRLVLRIAPEMTYRVLDDFSHCFTKNDDGSFTVTLDWSEDNWLYGYILSYGEYIEVLEPAHVGKIIYEKARRIVNNYSKKNV